MKKNILLFAIFISINMVSFSQSYQWWQNSYSGPGSNSQDTSSLVVMDNSGNVYVSGWTNGYGTNSDIILIKYNPLTGDSSWVRRI